MTDLDMELDGEVWAPAISYRDRMALADQAHAPKARKHMILTMVVITIRTLVIIWGVEVFAGGFMGDGALILMLALTWIHRVIPPAPDWREEYDRVPRTWRGQ